MKTIYLCTICQIHLQVRSSIDARCNLRNENWEDRDAYYYSIKRSSNAVKFLLWQKGEADVGNNIGEQNLDNLETRGFTETEIGK